MLLHSLVAAILVTGSSAYVVGSGVQANPSGCDVCGNNPVMGNWGPWGSWSSCYAGSQTRQRVCSAAQCPGGSSSESQPCAQYDPTPQWSEWGPWGTCSASCGGGQCTRTRLCNNGCSSCQCVGSSMETKSCNTQPCCSWTQWSQWSQCSVTCGAGGSQSRTRQCSCVTGCVGSSSEAQPCSNQQACPPPLCDTCQVQRDPVPCNTCYVPPPPPPAPAPCTTCAQPPAPCSTCGQPQPYYNPYGNRKRRALPAANQTVPAV